MLLHALRTKNDTSSQLLRLPPELRNAIGRLVLLADGDFIIDYYETQAAISILHTCWRLRHELIKIFFMENTFALSTPRRHQGGIHGDDAKERLKRFIQSFPADTVREIKTIYFYSSETRERSAGNIISRAGEASRVELAAYGHGQEPPVVWSAVEETRPGQVCGYVDRLCLGGMRKKDRTLMSARERLEEWSRVQGRG